MVDKRRPPPIDADVYVRLQHWCLDEGVHVSVGVERAITHFLEAQKRGG